MPSESSTKSPPADGDKHRHLDREIREMVSAITHRVTDFQKSGSTHHSEKEDEHDTRIITLAGTNDGATLRSELDEKSGKTSLGESEALSTFVNSNFQAVNNSIMFGGSYQANDPGVHLDISDLTDQPPQSHHHKVEKPGKKGKKKDKETSKTEH
ncbi:hypothetical protein VNO78_03935 [Psophocarpus tetragonolobus]|uniref:Uncharacterized protein n=1 Tax=Psophocarpus tetragonolobus TaxID=3891 RepID=A0AAN9XWC4_PSOTE